MNDSHDSHDPLDDGFQPGQESDGPQDPWLRDFAKRLSYMSPAEADAVFARFLRALGAPLSADLWATGSRPPVELLERELDEAKRQQHADIVVADLLSDLDLDL